MIDPRHGTCGRHRVALLDFVDRREHGPGSREALLHLERCPRCEADLAAVLRTIHAVRRALAEAATSEPPGDAWERLRERVTRPVSGAWQARSALAGLVVGAGLVSALVGPSAVFRPQGGVEQEPGPAAAVLHARTVADLAAESAFLNRVRVERPAPLIVSEVDLDAVVWRGPDGLGKPEVHVETDVPMRAD